MSTLTASIVGIMIMAAVAVILAVWSLRRRLVRTARVIDLVHVPGPLGGLYASLYLRGDPTMWLIDTGYAGPPVLNTWHLSREEAARKLHGHVKWIRAGSAERLHMCKLRHDETDAAWSLSQFTQRHGCATYSSRCNMRLASIGEERNHSAELILCPMLSLARSEILSHSERCRTREHPAADLVVTMRITGLPHILTLDYMSSYGDFRFDLGARPQLVLGASIPSGWTQLSTGQHQGVRTLRLQLYNGSASVAGWFIVDTGSAPPLAVNRSMCQRLSSVNDIPLGFTQQSGVHGEVTCASIELMEIMLEGVQGTTLRLQSPVLCNDLETAGVDGYIGLCLLAALGSVHFSADSLWVPQHDGTIKVPSNILQDVTRTQCETTSGRN